MSYNFQGRKQILTLGGAHKIEVFQLENMPESYIQCAEWVGGSIVLGDG